MEARFCRATLRGAALPAAGLERHLQRLIAPLDDIGTCRALLSTMRTSARSRLRASTSASSERTDRPCGPGASGREYLNFVRSTAAPSGGRGAAAVAACSAGPRDGAPHFARWTGARAAKSREASMSYRGASSRSLP